MPSTPRFSPQALIELLINAQHDLHFERGQEGRLGPRHADLLERPLEKSMECSPWAHDRLKKIQERLRRPVSDEKWLLQWAKEEIGALIDALENPDSEIEAANS